MYINFCFEEVLTLFYHGLRASTAINPYVLLHATGGVNFETKEELLRRLLSAINTSDLLSVQRVLRLAPRGLVNDIYTYPELGTSTTPFRVAIAKGYVPIIVLLANAGGDLLTDQFGNTPLSLAAENGHTAAIRFILNRLLQAQLDVKAYITPQVIAAARRSGNRSALFLLQHTLTGRTIPTAEDVRRQFFQQLRAGSVETINRLLNDYPQLIFTLGEGGVKPLGVAALRGDVPIIRVLLNHGSNVNGVDSSGYTPLQLAKSQNHIQAVQMLSAYGAI